MREIKFRGKRVDNGEWVYGCYVRYSESEGFIYGDYIDNKEVWKVDAKTVGQFTGMYDKKKHEIYEGDKVEGVSANIFSKGEKAIYTIAWGIDHWHAIGTYLCLQELRNLCQNNIKVIGTVHDKPIHKAK